VAEQQDMRTDRRKPHFDKSISYGHILTTVTMIIGFFVAANAFDRRVTINTQDITYLKQRADVERVEWRQDLRAINDKLDQLIRREISQ
jgi:hypothetical protein